MSENETRQPDHVQAWIDLVCHAAQVLHAEAFYEWLQMVGRGTDEERTRKGRAFLGLQAGGKLAEEVRISENFKLVPHAHSPGVVMVDKSQLTQFAAMVTDNLLNNRQPLDADDLTWARTTAWALGYTEGPSR